MSLVETGAYFETFSVALKLNLAKKDRLIKIPE